MAISVLLLYASGQIGSTYGGFNGTAETVSTIGFCKVFPDSIKQLLSELKEHLNTAQALKATLKSYSSPAGLTGITGIESMSLEELEIAEKEISRQVADLHSDLIAIEGQKTANAGIWNGIHAEISAAAAVLAQIGGYMIDLDPNCLEIRDKEFFDGLQNSLSQNGVLSESFTASIAAIVHYLEAIQNGNTPFPITVNEAVYSPLNSIPEEPSQLFPIIAAFGQSPGELSVELVSMYDKLDAELNSAKDTATAGISGLEQQQQLITQTRSKRLEEIEKARQEELAKAKKEEEAKLALEKQKKEDAEKAKAELKATPEPEAVSTAAPDVPEASATPAPAGDNQSTPPKGDVTETPTQEPQATEPPIPGPEMTASPSEPQLIKGGD
ncbi:hypothetical protein A3844_13105 [Paenibacillus helianthi]|uniref:Uncharacterized protein n=1 Tax=Paenibacillus helianthi TaxID=1349432 RepID=A0ABX3ERG8_9BACL|nr:hypothetical protein [Paenibacillus helianthi]OKP86475.1 hypothetical protein A3844_13105 [Paenibacillus helianthi]